MIIRLIIKKRGREGGFIRQLKPERKSRGLLKSSLTCGDIREFYCPVLNIVMNRLAALENALFCFSFFSATRTNLVFRGGKKLLWEGRYVCWLVIAFYALFTSRLMDILISLFTARNHLMACWSLKLLLPPPHCFVPSPLIRSQINSSSFRICLSAKRS